MTDSNPAAQAPPCDHYWSWVSPAGTNHAARICMSCHAPDPSWLNEIYEELETVRAERDEWRRVAGEQTRMERARAENAETRLALAREALVMTGYFTPEQVGDDVAPRILELFHNR